MAARFSSTSRCMPTTRQVVVQLFTRRPWMEEWPVDAAGEIDRRHEQLLRTPRSLRRRRSPCHDVVRTVSVEHEVLLEICVVLGRHFADRAGNHRRRSPRIAGTQEFRSEFQYSYSPRSGTAPGARAPRTPGRRDPTVSRTSRGTGRRAQAEGTPLAGNSHFPECTGLPDSPGAAERTVPG